MEGEAPPTAGSGSPTAISRFGYDPNLTEHEPIPSPTLHASKPREGTFQRLLKKAHSIAKSVGPASASPASPASHHPSLHHAPPARPDPTYVQQTIDEREGEAEAEAMLRAAQRRSVAAAAAAGGEGFFWDGDGPRGSAAAMHKKRVLALRRAQISQQQRSQAAQYQQPAPEGSAESTRPTHPSVVTGPPPPLTPPRQQQRGGGKCPKDSDSICESPGNPLLTPHSYTSSAWSTNSSIDRPSNTQAPGSPGTMLRPSAGSDLRLPQQPQAQPQPQPQPHPQPQQRRVLGANSKGDAWWARHSADPAFKTRLAATQVRMAGRASLGHGQAQAQAATRQGATVQQQPQQQQQLQQQVGARDFPDDSSRNSTPSFGLSTLPTTATTSSGPGLTSMSNPLGHLDGNGMHGSPSFQSSLSDINGGEVCSDGDEESGIQYIDALEFSHL